MPDYKKYRWTAKMGEVKYGGAVGGVHLDTSLLDTMAAEIKGKASQILKDFGNEITSDVYRRAPEDTGELKDSYLRESDLIEPLRFRIQDGVTYGIFQELGTSRIAAQPHVVPAIEDAEDELTKAIEDLFS
jgi:hypothetical protein